MVISKYSQINYPHVIRWISIIDLIQQDLKAK